MLSRINNIDKEKLIEQYKNLVFDDYYQYISSINMNEHCFADANNQYHVEFISKDKEDIIGYFFAKIDEGNPKIAIISNCINFKKEEKTIFGSDLKSFMNLLKKRGFNEKFKTIFNS